MRPDDRSSISSSVTGVRRLSALLVPLLLLAGMVPQPAAAADGITLSTLTTRTPPLPPQCSSGPVVAVTANAEVAVDRVEIAVAGVVRETVRDFGSAARQATVVRAAGPVVAGDVVQVRAYAVDGSSARLDVPVPTCDSADRGDLAPVTRLLLPPADSTFHGRVPFSVALTEDVAFAELVVRDAGGGVVVRQQISYWSAPVVLPPGSYDAQVTGWAWSGKSTVTPTTAFTVRPPNGDTTPPRVTAALGEPPFTLRADAADDHGVAAVVFRLGTQTSVDATAPYEATFPACSTSGISTVFAYDTAGNAQDAYAQTTCPETPVSSTALGPADDGAHVLVPPSSRLVLDLPAPRTGGHWMLPRPDPRIARISEHVVRSDGSLHAVLWTGPDETLAEIRLRVRHRCEHLGTCAPPDETFSVRVQLRLERPPDVPAVRRVPPRQPPTSAPELPPTYPSLPVVHVAPAPERTTVVQLRPGQQLVVERAPWIEPETSGPLYLEALERNLEWVHPGQEQSRAVYRALARGTTTLSEPRDDTCSTVRYPCPVASYAPPTMLEVHIREPGDPPSAALSLATRTPRVTHGNTPELTGKATRNGAPVVGRQVRLLAREYGTTSWVVASFASTSADGSYRFTARPERQTSYVAYMDGASSPPVLIQVAARITITAPSHLETVRRAVTVRGSGPVDSQVGFATIRNGRWVYRGEAPVLDAYNPQFRGAVALPPGEYTFVVYTSASRGLLAGSRSVRVRVV